MDIFDEEIIKFWKAMADCKVSYIMVGGYATNIHGYQRYTGDMRHLNKRYPGKQGKFKKGI